MGAKHVSTCWEISKILRLKSKIVLAVMKIVQKFVRWTFRGQCGHLGHNVLQIVDILSKGGQGLVLMEGTGGLNVLCLLKKKTEIVKQR